MKETNQSKQETGWRYVSYINHKEIAKSLTRSYLVMIGAVLLPLLVGIGVAYLLGGTIIRRLKLVSSAAGSIFLFKRLLPFQNNAHEQTSRPQIHRSIHPLSRKAILDALWLSL